MALDSSDLRVEGLDGGRQAEGDLSSGFALDAGQTGGRRDQPAMKNLGGDATVVTDRMQPAGHSLG
ncbi:MAG TPA: hypothetical protein VIJ34_09665 [Acidimicrobiales bacterium]